VGGVAFATGFIAGFLGVGGGFIRMPALMYVIGCPTIVAVGTDLFEVMISGAYGAFTYAYKGKVEIIAAVLMLMGAAVGAQFGTLATKYVKGLVIRLYFAITMLLTGVSVILKHISSQYRYLYEEAIKPYVLQQTGKSDLDLVAMRDWMVTHKDAVNAWLAGQPEAIRHAVVLEKAWSDCSGWLMLGAACALSIIIIAKMAQGAICERRVRTGAVKAEAVKVGAATAEAVKVKA